MLLHGVSFWKPSPDDLLICGANNAGAVLINGEWRRIVTAICLFMWGSFTGDQHVVPVEPWPPGRAVAGFGCMLAAYILTGAAGKLAFHVC